jgi:hypothetical protein
MTRVLFIGHSHMVCVLNAAQEAGLPFQAVTLKAVEDEAHFFGLDRALFIEDTGKPDFRDETKAVLAASTAPVYSFISGIMHVQLGLRRLDDPSEAPFDFVLPASADAPLDPDADLIPFDAIREVLRQQFKSRLKMLGRLAAIAPGRVVQFPPPPPVSDRWLEPLLEKTSVKATALPSRWVRWKLWRLTADIFREHARSLGARFVDAPAESMDGDGFLRDDLVRNATHGNTAFGALLLHQIRSR